MIVLGAIVAISVIGLLVLIGAVIMRRKNWKGIFSVGRDFHFINPKE
jgi:hypothetical protein